MSARLLRACTLLVLTALLGACAGMRSNDHAASQAWRDSGQLVLVVIDDWNSASGELMTFERGHGDWRATGFSTATTIGRDGAAWGLGLHPAQPDGAIKREGDGRSPAGAFALGEAFGYSADATTMMPYRAMTASDYCIDVPDSPLYNRIVDADVVGEDAVRGSTEPMRRDLHADGDPRYRLGFVIRHNDAAVDRGGSCIFAHLWRKPGQPTSGCTAMAAPAMDTLLAWLQPQREPLFVLLPRSEYKRLKRAWQLPDVD
jgi:L,D-peptidoglycan transpeptidase YkuD (ErfK/YbiS/YcfS/YnhG family)